MINTFRTAVSVFVMVTGFSIAPGWAGDDAATFKRTVLTQGGVALYEYSARPADGTITLDVPRSHVDDVLKSLTVMDARVRIAHVELPGEASLDVALGGSTLDEGAFDSLQTLLRALRGEMVEVTTTRTIRGRIVAVDPDSDNGPGALTLRENGHLVRIAIPDLREIEFVDPELKGRINDAVDLFQETGGDHRRLIITVDGRVTGAVTLAYVGPAPLWKSTYRLALDGDSGTLQGWAVLENYSGRDWQGIDLTLSSGNPVTFRQALYRAHFVDRPEVPVELFDRLLPSVDAGSMDSEYSESMPESMAQASRGMMLQQDKAGAASGFSADVTERMEQVLIHLGDDVTLGHGRTLTLPVAEDAVPARRVTYLPMHDNRPLAAFQIENRGKTALPPGVVTVYDVREGVSDYMGDARLGVVPAGEERLLAFAGDMTVRTERRQTASTHLGRARISDGILHVSEVVRHRASVDVVTPRGDGRMMVVDFDAADHWKLVSPDKDARRIAGGYRITKTLPAGQEAAVEARFEEERMRRFTLLDTNMAVLVDFASSGSLSGDMKAAMERIVTLRRDEAAARRALDTADERLAEARTQEERTRENLIAVGETELRQRYLDQLVEAEARVNEQTGERREAADRLRSAEEGLRTFVANLRIES